jgi:glutathione S-transferase
MKRFTVYGSPHSLPTYKVALMLHMSGEPFSFRYVSFQKGAHKTPEFQALSRWGQVPVLVEDGCVLVQATAIVEHLAETLGRFQGVAAATRQCVREWLYWEVDVLYPPIWNCAALSVLDSHLAHGNFLCSGDPTVADLVCRCDVAFAQISEIDLGRWKNVSNWAARVAALPGFKLPFELLSMADAELP